MYITDNQKVDSCKDFRDYARYHNLYWRAVMIFIHTTDIALLRQSGYVFKEIHIEPVEHRKKIWYQMFINLELASRSERYLVLNTRNAPRLWRRLDAIIEFVQDYLPEIEQISVKIPKKSNALGLIQ